MPKSLIKILIELQMPILGISVTEASWEGITAILESTTHLKRVYFKRSAGKCVISYPVCIMSLAMLKVKVGPDSMPN